MFLLSESQVDRVINNRAASFWGGVSLISLCFLLPSGWKFGAVVGISLIWRSIHAEAFRNWRTETGIWMLAALFFVGEAPCWFQIQYALWTNAIKNPVAGQGAPFVTWEIATRSLEAIYSLAVFTFCLRLSATVIFENWKRTRLPG